MTKGLGALVVMAVVGIGSSRADAAALLTISTGTFTVSCNTSLAINVGTNCLVADGFVANPGGDGIIYNPLPAVMPTGYTVGVMATGGNQPGTPDSGNILDAKFNVVHVSGTDDLTVDFAGSGFALPLGPTLLLSASSSATFGESEATDAYNVQAWGRADNALTVPGGTATTTVPPCLPGAGTTTACSESSAEVPFLRGAGNYSLTGRQIIHLSTDNNLGANFTATVAASGAAIPEPASLLLFGTGLLGLAARRRWTTARSGRSS